MYIVVIHGFLPDISSDSVHSVMSKRCAFCLDGKHGTGAKKRSVGKPLFFIFSIYFTS